VSPKIVAPKQIARPKQGRFQFGIRAMLVLTVVSAAAAATAGSLNAPAVVRVVVAVYLMSLAAYAVLRLPFVCRRIRGSIREWDRLRRQRVELETAVQKMRTEIQQAKSSANADPPAPRNRSDA
jgi:hypothetical protein